MYKTIAINQSKKNANNFSYLLFVNKTPPNYENVNSYFENGFLVSPQIGFYGLITAYFKTEKILLKNTNSFYHKQIKNQLCTK